MVLSEEFRRGKERNKWSCVKLMHGCVTGGNGDEIIKKKH